MSPKAAGNRTPTAPQQSFHLYFSLSSSACVSKLSSSAQNYKQKSLLWGAVQFSESCFSARQVKSRREYPLVFSRDFPQYWRKAASENLSGFGSPLLNLSDRPRSYPWSDSSGRRCTGSAQAASPAPDLRTWGRTQQRTAVPASDSAGLRAESTDPGR